MCEGDLRCGSLLGTTPRRTEAASRKQAASESGSKSRGAEGKETSRRGKKAASAALGQVRGRGVGNKRTGGKPHKKNRHRRHVRRGWELAQSSQAARAGNQESAAGTQQKQRSQKQQGQPVSRQQRVGSSGKRRSRSAGGTGRRNKTSKSRRAAAREGRRPGEAGGRADRPR